MTDIHSQVEELLWGRVQRIVYVRHRVGSDLVFFLCSNCVEGEHEEVVEEGEEPKLECPWGDG